MLILASIIASVLFVIFFLWSLIASEFTTTEGFYFSLGMGGIGFVATIFLCIIDRFRCKGRQIEQSDDDLMFEKLVTAFKDTFPNLTYELESDKWKAINISGKSKEVDICILAACGEVIVGIGDIFHLHFESDYEQEVEDAEAKAISAALKYVRDFIADKIVLKHRYRDKKLVAAGAYHLEENKYAVWIYPLLLRNWLCALLFRKVEIKEFVWSGPYEPDI